MIYFNKEIINKFGNTNKIYSNGKVVYQSYIKAIPKPEYTGWAVIGDVNGDSWSMDFPMYHYKNNPNIYYCDDVYFNDVLGMFKLRLNGDWGMQRGQSTSNIHNANEYISVYNGNGTSNVRVYNVVGTPYRIVFDLDNNTIIVEGETLENTEEIELVWGVIGDLDIGLWSAEVDMVKEGDNYVARDVIFANAEGNGCCFKIRQNHSWDVNFGSYGSAYHIGDEIPLYSYGNNICITDAIVGEPYVITYNPTMQTIIVDGKKYEEPEIPDVPEPEPDEPETPEIPEGVVSLQYCWDNQIFDMPFTDCYIDMNNVEDDASSYYFITLSSNPNSENDSITSYSICPKENSIFDNGNPVGNNWRMYIMEGFYNDNYNDTPVVATPLGNGIYYYKFNQPVYLSNKSDEVNAPYWRINVIPLTIEPDTPIIPDAPEGSKELVVTSISRGYVGGGEYEVIFELDDYTTIVIDYYNSNPLATGEYTMDNGYSDFGIIKSYTRWDSSLLDTCNSVVTNNGNNNYNFYVEFTLNGATYHFTYNGDL